MVGGIEELVQHAGQERPNGLRLLGDAPEAPGRIVCNHAGGDKPVTKGGEGGHPFIIGGRRLLALVDLVLVVP